MAHKKQTKYIIVTELHPYKALQEFARKVQEAVLEGYVVSDDINDVARPLSPSSFSITLRLQEQPFLKAPFPPAVPPAADEPEAVSTTTSVPTEPELFSFELKGTGKVDFDPLASFDECKTKAEIMDFAMQYGIEVPEDIKVVTAVKKYVRERLPA